MKNKPPYAITSVDHALRLARLLQREGQLTVSEAAEHLGVARSTAHRLLAMLVYRDFAERGTDRSYQAGPVLHRAGPMPEHTAALCDAALPHLQVLVAKVNETANLMVRVGSQARFITTVECDRALRVGDRTGRVLPAHLASGGKALLAALDAEQLSQLYSGDEAGLLRLRKELSLVRQRGFALNEQATEAGVSAIGVSLPGPGEPLAALSLAIPSARFHHDMLTAWVSALTTAAADIQRDMASPQAAPARHQPHPGH
jgi:IclR family transcriptional regulator, acetate operon repressor